MLLNTPETRKVKMELLCENYLDMNSEVAYRKVINCLNKAKLRKLVNIFRILVFWDRMQ